MDALTKRVEKLEAYVKNHKDKKDTKEKLIKRKKLDAVIQKMFNRPRVLVPEKEKKEEPGSDKE